MIQDIEKYSRLEVDIARMANPPDLSEMMEGTSFKEVGNNNSRDEASTSKPIITPLSAKALSILEIARKGKEGQQDIIRKYGQRRGSDMTMIRQMVAQVDRPVDTRSEVFGAKGSLLSILRSKRAPTLKEGEAPASVSVFEEKTNLKKCWSLNDAMKQWGPASTASQKMSADLKNRLADLSIHNLFLQEGNSRLVESWYSILDGMSDCNLKVLEQFIIEKDALTSDYKKTIPMTQTRKPRKQKKETWERYLDQLENLDLKEVPKAIALEYYAVNPTAALERELRNVNYISEVRESTSESS